MVKFTVDQIRKVMDNTSHIRNMSVIAHVDHGKTTLTDALVCKAGIISNKQAGNKMFTHTRDDEDGKGITIKSTGVSMCFDCDFEKTGNKDLYLINLIDSPGHVDFSSEVTAALRVTDGALVVVDCVEGVCVQTQTVLRQAMQQKIKPILMINKIDRNIFDLKYTGEEMYQAYIKIIDYVNVVVSNYQQEDMGQIELHPSLGNVAFGSGKQQWAFSLIQFARLYSNKFKVQFKKMMDKLWGDNFYDAAQKKWKKQEYTQKGQRLQRAFVSLVIQPISKLCKLIMDGALQQVFTFLANNKIQLTNDDKKNKGKDLLKLIMSKWLNAADCLIQIMVLHLPSPKEAQKYRTAYLYEGPQQDECAQAMRECNPNGPLMIYISKMVPSKEKGRFFAFGRVFSGTVSTSQKVRVMGPSYQPGKKHDMFQISIRSVVVMIGKNPCVIGDVPSGSTVALGGIEDYLLKNGTISNHPQAHCIRSMKFSVAPVVRVAVAPKNPKDLQKLIQGLKKLQKADNLVQCTIEQTGQNVVAGCGELHVDICLNDLQGYANCPIVRSNPIVTYKQTISTTSEVKCLKKTQNNHNRLWGYADPLDKQLIGIAENGQLSNDIKTRAKKLIEDFKWTKDDAMSIWTFGPQGINTNVVVDLTKGIQHMNQIRDSVQSAFSQATRCAALTQQHMRGVRFSLYDAQLHSDAIHRSAGQIMPAFRELAYGCQLTANPRLYQPIFNAQITVPMNEIGGVYDVLGQRRANLIEQAQVPGSSVRIVKTYLPVSQSFGFVSALRASTQGKAFPVCMFSHWQLMNDDPTQQGSKTNLIVNTIRKRKGLKKQLPNSLDYLDKL